MPTESDWFTILRSGISKRILGGLYGKHATALDVGSWWFSAALECINADKAQLITSRDGTVVYMLRCWLSPPQPCTNGQHAKYESGNAVLLHWILHPDDIPHLHNHPWTFQTNILAGGYIEERNGKGLMHEHIRSAGSLAVTGLGDFHRITSHLAGPGDPYTGHGGTWSLVTTGPRVQPWSFLIDGHAVDAEGFLRAKRDQEVADAIRNGTHYQ